MKKIIICFILFLMPLVASAASLSQQMSGRILLNVGRNGEAWYVNQTNHLRYYLGRPDDAFKIMRQLGLGISELQFQKIAQNGMPVVGDVILAKQLAGKIVLEVERNGEAWYINPVDLKKYYLGKPSDAYKVMRQLGLGISQENLAKIHKFGNSEQINQYSKYDHKTITTVNGTFKVDVDMIDLSNPKLKIITETADNFNCKTNCQAQNLAYFVNKNNGFAGINGTYFESSNVAKRNYYFFPVYNSGLNKLINDDQLKYWTTGPIMAFDQNNKFYYFKDSRDFKSVENFESTYGVKLQAAIGNKPRLIEDKMNVLIDWDVDPKQRFGRYLRNAIGYKDNKIYLVVAENSTIEDLAQIMQAMDVQYAINLDGGYSAALWYNDEYMVGPGRNIPNAIVFTEK
jgi:exopolysaccharide biosynthesis protein